MKILVIALSGIGDALMFTPSLNKLKEDYPSASIDVLAMFNGVKEIFENLDNVNRVLYHDFLNSSAFKSFGFILRLRGEYDITINVYPSNRREYNLISRIIGSPKRCGVNYLRRNFVNLGFLNNVTITENDNLHNVETNFKLCGQLSGKNTEQIPPLRIVISESDERYASNFLNDKGIELKDLVIGFHPGCSTLKNHDKRRWETDKFAKLASTLIERDSAKILIFGGPEEKDLKLDICSRVNSPSVISVEARSILESTSVMKRCNLFVSNDSSLMHIAAALKLKTVAILGPTNKNYIYPWQTEHRVASLQLECSPCFYYSPKPLTCSRNDLKFKCIRDLNPEKVYDIVKDFLKTGSTGVK